MSLERSFPVFNAQNLSFIAWGRPCFLFTQQLFCRETSVIVTSFRGFHCFTRHTFTDIGIVTSEQRVFLLNASAWTNSGTANKSAGLIRTAAFIDLPWLIPAWLSFIQFKRGYNTFVNERSRRNQFDTLFIARLCLLTRTLENTRRSLRSSNPSLRARDFVSKRFEALLFPSYHCATERSKQIRERGSCACVFRNIDALDNYAGSFGFPRGPCATHAFALAGENLGARVPGGDVRPRALAGITAKWIITKQSRSCSTHCLTFLILRVITGSQRCTNKIIYLLPFRRGSRFNAYNFFAVCVSSLPFY